MELWDLYDEDRNPTGRTAVRGEELAPGDFHLIVHIGLFNSRGRMLIQRRQLFKKSWPGLWDFSAGGCVKAGETSRRGAARELFEEIGVREEEKRLRRVVTLQFESGFDDIYLLKRDEKAEDFSLQKEEVLAVRWAEREEIEAMIDRGEFVPYHKSLFSLLFDLSEDPSYFTNSAVWAGTPGGIK